MLGPRCSGHLTILSRKAKQRRYLPDGNVLGKPGRIAIRAAAGQLPDPLGNSWQTLPPHWGSQHVSKGVDMLTQHVPGAIQAAPPAALRDWAVSNLSVPSSSASLLPASETTAAEASLHSATAAAADLTGTVAATATAAGSSSEHALGVMAEWVHSQMAWMEEPAFLTLNRALEELKQAASLAALLPPDTWQAPHASSSPAAAAGASLAGNTAATQAAIRAIVEQHAAAGASSLAAGSTAEDVLAQLSALLPALPAGGHMGSPSLMTLTLLVPSVMAVVAATAPAAGYEGYTTLFPHDDPRHTKLSHEYEAGAVAEHFRRRPVAVAQRAAQVAAEAASFGAALLLDIWTNRVEANEVTRAEQLRGCIERLGPAYVKVAQALSTRSDLLSPAYLNQIRLLQDRVPPFPCSLAKAAMEEAFGQAPEQVFSTVSEQPVAAASLGQVYRATLRPELGGAEVAVKVLRPGVLEQVGLDLHIMREAALILSRSGRTSADVVGVIDEWALRFYAEMDYRAEARNAEQLRRHMATLKGIEVAAVVSELSTADVLTTLWVDGEKLGKSGAADVRELCTTLLNAYLIQLLDTGFLHADPHPGNLIRTPEGKICIVDYGLMTQVTEEQRWALLEFIAHLSVEDWEAVAYDMQRMGFIPQGVNPKEAGLVEPLGAIMAQLVSPGGASSVDIKQITSQLVDLGKKYPFQIPPFFALILRAFSVIEGIALSVDPDYAIVKECFPYLSRRLLQDRTGRANAILHDLLYGNRKRLDIKRLNRLVNSFGAFTTSGLVQTPQAEQQQQQQQQWLGSAGSGLALSSTSTSVEAGVKEEGLDPLVREALVVMFGRPATYVQDLLVEEAVVAVDALSRGALSAVLQAVLGTAPATLASNAVAALGPLRGLLLPVPTPVELLSRLSPALAFTPEDQEALLVIRGIVLWMQKMPLAQGPTGSIPQLGRVASDLGTLLPELSPGLTYMTEAFMRAVATRTMQRLGSTLPLLEVRELESAMAALNLAPAQHSRQQQLR